MAMKKTPNIKFNAIILFLMFLGAIFVQYAFSSLSNTAIIQNSGFVVGSNSGIHVIAASGSAFDIQEAVDSIASTGGTVHIPAGTWDFTSVGTWATVNVPAGVSIAGAPNQRFSNGSNVGWNTVLIQNWDVPSDQNVGIKTWFKLNGNSDPSKPSRFSNIKLQGYEDIAHSNYYLTAISVYGVVNFRIDHCYFRNVRAGIGLTSSTNNAINGVIDHNNFINTNTDVGGSSWNDALHNVDYGIMPYGSPRNTAAIWDSNIYNVVGKYTDHSIYIENNYFTEWKHCVSSNNGMHYVFRYNIISGGNGRDLDGHGAYTNIGTRAMEFYGNQFLDPNYRYETQPYVVNWRGGGGVFFNNTIRDYYFTVYFRNEGSQFPQGYPGSTDCPVYFWANNYLHGGQHHDQPVQFQSGETPGANFHNNTPMPNYTPYVYPHPLALET